MVAGGLVRPGGRNARVRTRVVWALLVELGDRPFDTVTMSGLATRSGIARATLHRRWGDPGAVLADAADDLLQRRMGRGIGTISRAAPDPRPSSTDLLVVHLRSLVTWLSRPETSAVLLAAMARTQHDDVLAVRTVGLWDHELDDLRRVPPGRSRQRPSGTSSGPRRVSSARSWCGCCSVIDLLAGPGVRQLAEDFIQELLWVCRRNA